MFVVSKLAIVLISPLGASLFGGLLAVVAALTGRRRFAVWLGALALVWLWFWSLPVASNWVRGYLEDQHPPMAVHEVPQAEAIVVLGGGVSPAGHGDLYPNLESGADRVWHAARLFHASKAPLVLRKRQRISTYNSRTVPDTLIPSQPLGGITHEHY